MKEDNDKKLQQLIEEGSALPFETFSASDEEDLFAYQTLFNHLKTEPAEGLPYAFAAKVRRAVELKALLKTNTRFYLTAILIFAFVAVTGYFMLALVNKEAGNLALSVILKYKWLLLMGLATFVGLQLFNPSAPEENLAK
jgi:hypothetical protein